MVIILILIIVYLFQLLRKCVVTLANPVVEGPLGQPPFESPPIHKAVQNLLVYKYSHIGQQEMKTMYELSNILFHCLNTLDFPPPSTQKHIVREEDLANYKIDYTRQAQWILRPRYRCIYFDQCYVRTLCAKQLNSEPGVLYPYFFDFNQSIEMKYNYFSRI